MASRPLKHLLSTLVLILLAQITFASPLSQPNDDSLAARSFRPNNKRGAPDLSGLTLPSSSLPPPTGLKLKHVALGVGTQNYTCTQTTPDYNTSASATPTPVAPAAFGALAALYDIGPFLSSPLGALFQNALPPLALAMYGALTPSDHASAWRNMVAQMPAAGQDALSAAAFGEHFFADVASTLTPTWAMLPSASLYPEEPTSILWQGKKAASADAPPGSCAGLAGEGAVPWLYLTRVTATDGEAIEAVYRVVTAGGMQPDTCDGVTGGQVEVKYAAEYWFFGPE